MKNKEQTENNVINYPRFIDNAPCKDDLFEGKSHKKIAENISRLLQNNENCNVIGIDGGWGSGKSNLVELVKYCLKNDKKTNGKFRFFIYDAWGHQDDLQRRSILEELTDYLTNGNKEEEGILDTQTWKPKLKDLLAKKREVETKTIPKISCGIILSAIAIIITPLLDVITDSLESKVWKIIIMSIPLSLILILMIVYIIKNLFKFKKEKGFWWTIKLSMNDFFNVYTDRQKEDTTFETISENEPSSHKFKVWMHEIDKDIQGYTLIVVFDNMDRLPNQKVQELWSAIHTFFADEKYDTIRVIVPFDREHIKSAFKNEDINDGDNIRNCFGDDFINKTFNVIYRVSPPTMSNWKDYFRMQWKYAFGNNTSADSDVTQIYDLLTTEQTPRKIIAFINEFVSIKRLTVDENIPDKYIALFIFGKSTIANNPAKEILQPSYLGALDFMYMDDKDLPKYMSALYYQLPAEKALDIIYTERLKQALDINNVEQIKQIQSLPNLFFPIIENAITKVSNLPNAVLALNECFTEENKHTRKVWDCVYKKDGRQEDTLQDYQKILLKKISDKEEYLMKIVGDFNTSQNFVATKYYESILQLGELNDIDPYKYLEEKEVDPEMFIEFVEEANDEYDKYKLVCNQDKLDEYLSELNMEQLQTLTAIPYIKDEYTISGYIFNLKSLIDKNSNNKDNIKVLYARLKEVERPIIKKLPDDHIYTFFNNTNNSDDFYYDLICMRIARLDGYHPSYQSVFSTVLNNTEDAFVEKVAERIEYYIDYGTILLNTSIMNYPLFKEVAKKITVKSYGTSRMILLSVLNGYDTIINNLSINSAIFIKKLNNWSNKDITKDNVNSIPIKFFEDISVINNDLTKHCISVAKEYLTSISTEGWKESIIKGNFNYKLLIILKLKIQNCFDAFKDVLVEYAKGIYKSLTKERCMEIIDLANNNSRSLLTAFNNVRDCFCDGQTMTNDLFDFFGEWLLEYSKLEDKQSSLRTIFIPSLLNVQENVQLIIKYKNKMIQIVNKAGEESTDFKDKIQSLLESEYKSNKGFIAFAKEIGVEAIELQNDVGMKND